ncbi:hypothetical protein [Helicobacter sp. T3_23-1059]
MEKSTLCIEFFDFDSGKKIENGRAEIKNIDNKNMEICTIVNGKVTLSIDKEHIADFYSVCLSMMMEANKALIFLLKHAKK